MICRLTKGAMAPSDRSSKHQPLIQPSVPGTWRGAEAPRTATGLNKDFTMLRNASDLNGFDIAATDGLLGTVSDAFFDDSSWSIRWLVVATGSWTGKRHVLLPVSALGQINPSLRQLAVSVTRARVADSPDIDAHQPISRQMETGLYDHYGWSPYWTTGFGVGALVPTNDRGSLSPELGSSWQDQPMMLTGEQLQEQLHLRSVSAVIGYHLHATDGEIGHLEDFVIDDATWRIQAIAAKTRNWWPGQHVEIATSHVTGINWYQRTISVGLDRLAVKASLPALITPPPKPARDAASV